MARLIRYTSVTLAMAAALTTTLPAQERLELVTELGNGTDWRMVPFDASVSGFGAVGPATRLDFDYVRSRPVALAGGRYIVIPTSSTCCGYKLTVFDRRTRTPRVVDGLLPPGFDVGAMAVDPLRPRLFLADKTFAAPSHAIWMIDAQSMTGTPVFGDAAHIGPLAYAAGSDVLFASLASRLSQPPQIVAIPLSGSRAVERFDLGMLSLVLDLAVDRAGRRLWMYGVDLQPPFSGLRLRDAATGQELARAPLDSNRLLFDEARGIVLAPLVREGRLAVHDAATLATLAILRVDAPPFITFNIERWFQAVEGRWMTGAYVVRTEVRNVPRTCNAIWVDALDPDGSRRASADVLAQLGAGQRGCTVWPVLVRSPFAPAGLNAHVSGRRVTLGWTNPGDVSEFEIQAGTLPGVTSLSQRVGFETTAMTFDNVPPGVYYVRVRAFNEVGGSPVSNEVQVVVR